MEKDLAIKVENVSKTFRIPHEKITSLRGAFVSVLSRDKGYEEFQALDDVSFEVKKGEFFGIIGRNGSGKSTLLKILAGIYQVDKGKVKVYGLISPFLELGIGFNPELSGRDNVFLNAAVLGLTHKQIEEKFDDIVEFAELRRFIDQKTKNYSSGMQVRLMFSVAIHANREVLLMDEVLAVGDTNFQSKCLEKFNEYRNEGKTVVLVTHDIGTVQRYCDRAMLLRNGKIEMIGDPEEVGNKYIYQNMSDEERRLFDEEKRNIARAERGLKNMKGEELEKEKGRIEREKKKQEEEKRNKIAEIIKVDFLNKTGNSKNVFETGEDMSIRVYFKKNKPVDVLNFSIAIFNQENHYVFGIHTFSEKIDAKKCIDRGYYQVDYRNIPLRTNTYYINSAIYGKSDRAAYDFMPKSKFFKVFSKDKNYGMVDIDYAWS
jgi:ABC-type polysaccharide/polyol phosphate transport system ATPase subunit